MKTKNSTGYLSLRLLPLLILTVLAGCLSPEKKSNISVEAGIETRNRFARGFSIELFRDFRILHVRDPWQGSSGIHLAYVLSAQPGKIPDSLSHLPAIQTPVKRVICMSTTHVAMISALGRTETIVGISGPDYISDPLLRRRIESGEVLDVGADQSLNYERIISLKPDLVISYAVTAEISGMVKRLGELGIPVIVNGDYLENEPLGKTEWLKFMAEFYGMEREAGSIFDRVCGEYESYRERVKQAVVDPAGNSPGNAAPLPTVITGLPWKDAWYIPGGKSFAAAFFRDAGADYLWKDMESREASPVDLESVFARSLEADFWINCGNALSLDDIRRTEARLEKLGPLKKNQVYNNTARLNSTGGNDFWETGVMEPHLILADLIKILHPGILPEHELKYYRKLH